MVQSPSWEANQFSASQEIPTFYGTQTLITTFTNACHLSLSWASSIQSTPHIPLHEDPSLYYLPIYAWVSQMVSFPQVSSPKPLLSPISTTCPSHLILLNFITQTIMGEEYRSLSSALCSFLHSLFTSSLLGPNILLNTLFSNTLSLRSSLNVSDQLSHPYTTTGKIIVSPGPSLLYECLVTWYALMVMSC